MHSKIGLLKELGYIKNEALTEKGKFASKIYGYELSLTELYACGIMENLSAREIAILCLALVFEPKKRSSMPALSKETRRLTQHTEKIVGALNRMEKLKKIVPLSKSYHFNLTPCFEAWINNYNFDKIFSFTDADEGELIRYFRMCIQILREILDTPASDALKNKIKSIIDLINRDIVDAEKQLRE